MIFAGLLMLKIILFMSITSIHYNRALVFITSLLITMLIFSIIYFSKYKKKNMVALLIYSLISAVMFVDVMHYSYFNTLPSIGMLNLVGELGAVGDSILTLLSIKSIAFVMDIPLLIIYVTKFNKKERTYNNYIRFGIPGGIGIILVILLLLLNINDILTPVSNQELFTYHIKDIKDTLFKGDVVEGYGSIDEIEERLEEMDDLEDLGELDGTEGFLDELRSRSELIEGEYTGLGKDKNLIVIQVEALQNFVINRFYDGQEITPNLNKLVEEKGSLYFNNYYQQIGRGNTSDAEFVTNNSLYPSAEEASYREYTDNTFYGLPWILRDKGYTSWVFHGYEKEFWNRENAYVNQGFKKFISEEDYEFTNNESIGFGIIDEVFYDQTIDYIKELDSVDDNPFHAFIISLTSHTPFTMPKEYQDLNIRDEHEGTILGDYLQSIHYADEALGQFIEDLKTEGYYDDSVIALYGDHYAITGLNDSGVELMRNFLEEPYDLDEMMKIPLLIHIPDLESKETVDKLGSQIDFLPTILNIMGYENQKGLMFGRDLLNYEGDTFVAPITYVIKGSFIDDENIFFMGRNGIFDHGTAKYKETKEKIEDLEPLRETYELVIDEINRSDFVLKTDLLKYLLENNGEVDLDSINISNIPDDAEIIKCYDDPMKELENNRLSGSQILSVNVKWSEDGKNVLLSNNTNIDELAQWMVDHEDIYITISSFEEDESIFLKIKDTYSELMDRFVVEMTDFEHHIRLSNKAYRNIMLNLTENKYSEEEIIAFLDRTPLTGVMIDSELENSPLIGELVEMGISVYLDEESRRTLVR